MDFRTKNKSLNPLVTIGVLSYNYSSYVIETLNSIYNQTYGNIQLLIIDDHSTDNSVELINNWIKDKNVNCEFIIHEKNYGRNRACNTIIKKAAGKYLVLFSSDDSMLPSKIESQVNLMENTSVEYALCYSDAELINEQGEHRGLYSATHQSSNIEGNVFEEYYNRKFFICAPTIFFRKKIFEAIGNYDEKVTIEDYDMWMRLLPRFKIKYCDYVGIKYRVKETLVQSKTQTLADKRYYHRNRLYIYSKLYNMLRSENKYPIIKNDLVRKINFHLIHLKQIHTSDFWRILLFLLKNSFYKIAFVKILKLQFQFLLVFSKSKIIPKEKAVIN